VQGAASKFSTAAVRTMQVRQQRIPVERSDIGCHECFPYHFCTVQALSASLKIEIPETTSIVAGEGLRPERIRGSIVLEDVDFSYPERPSQKVLNGLSLKIHPNSFVALVGASGGGKSTLTALLERFYDPDDGSILLDGRDMRGLDPRWIRQQIGYVEQTPAMFAGTIKENILYGNPTATDEEIKEAARQANVRSGLHCSR